MRGRPKLLDVVEVAAVDDREDAEQTLEDRHSRLLEVLRVRGVWKQNKKGVPSRAFWGHRGGGGGIQPRGRNRCCSPAACALDVTQ